MFLNYLDDWYHPDSIPIHDVCDRRLILWLVHNIDISLDLFHIHIALKFSINLLEGVYTMEISYWEILVTQMSYLLILILFYTSILKNILTKPYRTKPNHTTPYHIMPNPNLKFIPKPYFKTLNSTTEKRPNLGR